MAQIPNSNHLKSSPKSSQKPPNSLQNATITITPEQALEFKGRIPTGIKDQVMAINKQKRWERAAPKRELIAKRERDNAIVVQQKMDAFLEEFLKNGGNATKAAMAVFDVKSRSSAANIGSVYLKKARELGRVYLEEKGYSWGRLLTIAAKKAEESRLPDWWDRVMGVAGYENPGASTKHVMGATTNVNIMQNEKEIFKRYALNVTEGEVVEQEEQKEEDGS